MFYLGNDVAKAKLHTRLLLGDEGKVKTKVVENSVADITAPAWVDAGIPVSLVNPAQVKDFAGGAWPDRAPRGMLAAMNHSPTTPLKP